MTPDQLHKLQTAVEQGWMFQADYTGDDSVCVSAYRDFTGDKTQHHVHDGDNVVPPLAAVLADIESGTFEDVYQDDPFTISEEADESLLAMLSSSSI